MHNASTAGSPSSITRTDWDSLPLGEDLSHLCGGRNKHPALAGEVEEVKDDSVRPFTAAELLGDVSIG
jgi:hypothetical protein